MVLKQAVSAGLFSGLQRLSPGNLPIRVKLALVSLSLLIIPWVGYRYVNEMESYLREQQEARLLDRARLVASLINQIPQVKTPQSHADEANAAQEDIEHLYIKPLKELILMDGNISDWFGFEERVYSFEAPAGNPPLESDREQGKKDLAYQFQIGSITPFVYALFQVKDDSVIFKQARKTHLPTADHLQIAFRNGKGVFRQYVVPLLNASKTHAYEFPDINRPGELIAEKNIVARARKTGDGYNLEVRIPISMLGDKLAFAIADVDSSKNPKVEDIVRTSNSSKLEGIASIIIPSPELDATLEKIHRRGARVWITDAKGRVVAIHGSLKRTNTDIYELDRSSELGATDILSSIVRWFYTSLLTTTDNTSGFHDDLSTASWLNSEEIKKAIDGVAATRWRQTNDERINILSAAYPVSINGTVKGVVAIEETNGSILILQNRAVEALLNLSLLALTITALTVFMFATRLSLRVKKLRDSAEQAIADDGKVVGSIEVSPARDELGDLSRSMANMLDRLAEYNRYLESMASKLSHELRTPITVVRSSLENLESTELSEETRSYSKRAKEGVERLSNILTRMSEATRLEQTIQQEEKENFNLEAVLQSCIKGYQMAHPNQTFTLDVVNKKADQAIHINGVADLIAQLLDKLVSNAMDFALGDTAIDIRLQKKRNAVLLSVSNKGPTLSDAVKYTLFDSMVSAREKKGEQPHLGLGLYIVRLIAEFHDARVNAENQKDMSGVVFSVLFPG